MIGGGIGKGIRPDKFSSNDFDVDSVWIKFLSKLPIALFHRLKLFN